MGSEAQVCRPVAATPVVLGTAAIWAAPRDVLGLGAGWALSLCLLAWLFAHALNRNIDQLIKAIETAESGLMRRATQRRAALGRALHLALYLSVAAAAPLAASVYAGLIPWLSPSLRLPMPPGVPPWVLVGLALMPAAATRYYWHPVAWHATLLGGRRKFTVVAKPAEAA